MRSFVLTRALSAELTDAVLEWWLDNSQPWSGLRTISTRVMGLLDNSRNTTPRLEPRSYVSRVVHAMNMDG